MSEKRKVFRIGIAMAGAISAGAYTAGVIDYLLETLSKWERAKELNRQLSKDDPRYDPSVPDHDVIIEIIGGSSAGGMTAAITALSLFEGIRPVNQNNPNKEQNKLYDAWVNLNDEVGGGPTFQQMLRTDDIFDEDGVISILNSKPVEAIAHRATSLHRVNKLPDYISPDLEIILTVTSLKGIPLAINFYEDAKKQRSLGKTPTPAHKMNLHKGIAHFRVQRAEGYGVPDHILPFNPESESHKSVLADAAIATGAFPVGLAPRHLRHIPTTYVRAMVQRMFSKPRIEGEADAASIAYNSLRIELEGEEFDFFAVDGGAINNEPFGEVIRALEEKCADDEEKNYAILLIDPFPEFEPAEEKARETAPKLIEMLPQFLGAIRGQAMMKEGDLIEGLSENHTLRMVFPSRRDEQGNKDPYPICCGSLDGFGGFFSKAFREHDFELGRRNCQSFLRRYFTIPLERAEQMSVFEGWSPEDPRHRRYYSEESNGYPIIPDMDFQPGVSDFSYPAKTGIALEEIFALEKPLYHRLKEVLANIDRYDKAEPTREARDLNRQVEWLMRQHYGFSTWKQLLGDLATYTGKTLWKYYGASKLAGILTRTAIKSILIDFKRRGLLEEKKDVK
jgi:hypothetical protein